MITISISQFKQFFKTKGFESQILQKSHLLNQDQLFVNLGEDEKLRDLVAQVQIIKQDLASSDFRQETKNYYHIQILLLLPFNAEEESVLELLRFIQVINRAANISGFEVSEGDGVIYYRHAFLHAEDLIDEDLLAALVGTILLQVHTFGRIIEDVAKGSKTCEEALKTVKEYEKQLLSEM